MITKYLLVLSGCLLLVSCASDSALINNQLAAKNNTSLGLVYLQNGNVTLAKSKLLLAIQQNPQDPMLLDAWGYFYEKTSDHKLAEKYYLKAIKIAPHQGEMHNNYGVFLCREKRFKEARMQFILAMKDPYYLGGEKARGNLNYCAARTSTAKS